MQNRLKIFLVLLLFSHLFSCNKEKCNCAESDFVGKWQAEMFMSLEWVAYPKDNDYSPVIEFNSDGTYRVILDVNSCAGSYKVKENSPLECSPAGCTKICCDSSFSQKLIEMLPQVTTFKMEEEMLRLNVPEWGWIELSRVSN